MNINLTREELDKLIKSNDLERYTQQQFKQFVESNEEVLIKGERGELDDIEKSEYDTLIAELQSFTTVNVFDTAPESKNRIVKSIEFIRPKQVEWDEIEKSEDGEEDLSKARSGVYTDTPLNRKLGRVGQKYGSKKQSTDEGDDKGKSHKLGDVPWESTSFHSLKEGGYGLTFNTKDGKKSVKVEGKDVEKLMSGSKEEKQEIKKKYFNQSSDSDYKKKPDGIKREYIFQYKDRFGEIQQKSFIASNEEQAMKMAKERIAGTDIQPSKVPDKTGREEKD